MWASLCWLNLWHSTSELPQPVQPINFAAPEKAKPTPPSPATWLHGASYERDVQTNQFEEAHLQPAA